MNNDIVIVGGDHHNTLGVIESFAAKGIFSYVIILSETKYSYVLYSKFIKDGWLCTNENDVIKCLCKNFTNTINKAVLIATNDQTANLIDKNHKLLTSYFYISTVEPFGTLSQTMSKEYMSDLARKVGLNVPKTWIMKNDKIPNDISFPIITKAISSIEGTKSNIKVCRKKDELYTFISSQKECQTVQLQSYIEKKFEFQLIGVSLNHGENIIIPGRTHIERPNGLDNTFFLKYDKYESELETLVNKAKAFVKETKYTGLFSIEFLKNKNDGKSYFMEMNFRNDGNAICVTASGINLPYILYLSQIGENYEKELLFDDIRKIYLVPEIYYFTCMLLGEISFKEWWKNMKLANCYTTYFKNDRKVFFKFIFNAIKKRING